MFVPPADDRVNAYPKHDEANKAIKDLRATPGHTVSQPVDQQHCGITKTIMFQFASALFFVFSQSSSFCKNAQ